MSDWRNGPESASEFGVIRATDVMVPMRDGVRLATDVYFPAPLSQPDRRDDQTRPVILVRTPYNKTGMADNAEYFARRGYVVAIQDCRGRYRSEGTFYFLTQEAEDGFDAVEWAGTQPWSDGRVGMFGTSYLGWTQTAAAVMNPPHLSALVVNQAGANAYSSSVRHNGAIELRFLAWAFMGAATGSEAIADPQVRAALESVRASEWLKSLPWHEGQTPLVHAYSYERWALDLYRNGDYGEYWEHPGFNFEKHWGNHADVPTLLCGAWYDSYTRATIENYVGLSERLSNPVHLVLGPWTHGGLTVDQTFSGNVEFGSAGPVAGNLADDFNHLHLRWFDRWLKGIDNGVESEGPVRLFVMGGEPEHRTPEGRLYRGGHWRNEQSFPLDRATPTAFYLTPDGGLSTSRPDASSGSTPFRFDPEQPVPTIGGNMSSLSEVYPVPPEIAGKITYEQRWGSIVAVGGQDQRDPGPGGHPGQPLNARPDVASFQTPPLGEPLEMVGPLRAVLYISSDAPDTDFTVKLVDVVPPVPGFPEGYHLNISDSIFRCRYRNSFSDPEPMQPGEVCRIEIPMYGSGTIFGAGHRIRVDISSSNFPRFDVNPNTGEPLGRHTHIRPALNTIHHSHDHPSHISLPLVPPDE
jgi:putative CocE/NonD family hydrolase